MARPDSRLARIAETRQQGIDRVISNRKTAFERKVVRKLLKAYGETPLSLKVKEPQDGSDSYEEFLSLSWLHDEYSDIPIRLIAHELDGTKLVETLFQPWKRTGVWATWHGLREDYIDSRFSIGCVTNTDLWGIMVVHDMVFPSLYADILRRGSVITQWTIDDYTVFMEPLESFSVRLSKVWSMGHEQ